MDGVNNLMNAEEQIYIKTMTKLHKSHVLLIDSTEYFVGYVTLFKLTYIQGFPSS